MQGENKSKRQNGGKKTLELHGKLHFKKLAEKRWKEYGKSKLRNV